MKKIISIFYAMLICISVNAQTKSTDLSKTTPLPLKYDLYIKLVSTKALKVVEFPGDTQEDIDGVLHSPSGLAFANLKGERSSGASDSGRTKNP